MARISIPEEKISWFCRQNHIQRLALFGSVLRDDFGPDSDDSMRLRHTLDHSVEAVEMAAGKDRQDLKTDRQFCLAMTRVVDIVGEAVESV